MTARRPQPLVPPSRLAGYSGTPLPKKLGIKEGSRVALLDAPPDFGKVIGELPPGAVLQAGGAGRCDLMLWFVRSRQALRSHIKMIAGRSDLRGVWIVWPKKASGMPTDLTQQEVREAGLGSGLVDYKVCAVDDTWSGLLFTRRKS